MALVWELCPFPCLILRASAQRDAPMASVWVGVYGLRSKLFHHAVASLSLPSELEWRRKRTRGWVWINAEITILASLHQRDRPHYQ